MAQLDLSNAHITPIYSPANDATYLSLTSGNWNFSDASGNAISSGSGSILSQNVGDFKIYYSGSFTASGTQFFVGKINTQPIWRVTGVSFASGDTYSFTIKANIQLNS